eukprot:29489_1
MALAEQQSQRIQGQRQQLNQRLSFRSGRLSLCLFLRGQYSKMMHHFIMYVDTIW